jgi:hypothetical protein
MSTGDPKSPGTDAQRWSQCGSFAQRVGRGHLGAKTAAQVTAIASIDAVLIGRRHIGHCG